MYVLRLLVHYFKVSFLFQWTFILADLLVIGAALWCYFITQSTRVLIYPAAVFLGFGLSAMFVNALSFAAELVGENKVIILVESNVQSL